MAPRRLPSVLLLLAGVAALGLGLAALERIFAQEREDAREALGETRRRLGELASQALRAELPHRMRASRPAFELAVSDPLAPAEGLFLSVHGVAVLPRHVPPLAGDQTPAQDFYQSLHPLPPSSDDAGRTRLFAVANALQAGDVPRAQMAFALFCKWLGASEGADLPAPEAVALRLTATELLAREGALPPAAAADLQRSLLRERAHLTRADFDFLFGRIMALAPTRSAAFLQRARELGSGTLVLPEHLTGPVLLGERWYLEPEEEAVRGISLDLPAVLSELGRALEREGSIPPHAQLRLAGHDVLVPREALSVELELPSWEHAEARAQARFELKTALVVVTFVLALGVAALALLAQERRRRYLELKADFVATVSHELKTPVASIRLLAEALAEARAGQGPLQDYPSRIVRAADELHLLVENVLNFHTLTHRTGELHRTPVRLEELLVPLRRELSELSARPTQLAADLGETEVMGERALLGLLFSNLARNAYLHNTRTPVRLEVRARTDVHGAVTVSFSDNGVGIPEAQWNRIFEDFVRLPNEHRSSHGGGLGLALCRRIMELHHGRIRVTASGPDGSTFALFFPALS